MTLLHGLASNARIWNLVAPWLADRGMAPIAPDSRGHGRSDKPDGDYSFEALTTDLGAFIEATHQERPLLVGHSWGASVVLDYAARFFVGPRCPKGIVLVDGGMHQMDDEPGATWERIQKRLSPPNVVGMPFEKFASDLEQWNQNWLPSDEEKEQIINIYLANFEVDEEERISPHLTYENHMQIVRAMWEFPVYQRYEQIRCPVLLVASRPKQPQTAREETFESAKQRGIAKAQQSIKDLQVHWIENSIHDIPLQRPWELAELITGFAERIQ